MTKLWTTLLLSALFAVAVGCISRGNRESALASEALVEPVEDPFKICREREGEARFYGSGNEVHATIKLVKQGTTTVFEKGSCRWLDKGTVLEGYSSSKYLECTNGDLIMTDEPRPLDHEPTVRVRRGDVVEVELTQCINQTAAAAPAAAALTTAPDDQWFLACHSMYGKSRIAVRAGHASATAQLANGSLLRYEDSTCQVHRTKTNDLKSERITCNSKNLRLTDEPRNATAPREINIYSGDNIYVLFNKCEWSTTDFTEAGP